MGCNTKVKIRYQLYDDNGNEVLEPFYCLRSAEYMRDTYFTNCQVIEIEQIEGE